MTGQVPIKSYGLIGNGRVASHFAHYFNELGIPFIQWARNSKSKSSSILTEEYFKEASTILLLISDKSIDSFIEENPFLKTKTLIHFSGSLQSINAIGFHPLMTFGKELYPFQTYTRITFVGEDDESKFREVFPQLANAYYKIPKELKGLYHSLCVMSNNFTTLLWQKFYREMEVKLGVPSSAAAPFLEQTFKNILDNAALALTGPLARGDRETIQKNIESLHGDTYQKVYSAFVEAYENP